jgi:hypothetical protein
MRKVIQTAGNYELEPQLDQIYRGDDGDQWFLLSFNPSPALELLLIPFIDDLTADPP